MVWVDVALKLASGAWVGIGMAVAPGDGLAVSGGVSRWQPNNVRLKAIQKTTPHSSLIMSFIISSRIQLEVPLGIPPELSLLSR
jgi:hypothetical protein